MIFVKDHNVCLRRSKEMKKIIVVLAFLIVAILVACSTTYKSLTAEMPELSTKTDGVYRGEYDLESTPVKVTLDVIVQNGQITNIQIIKHRRSPIGKKAEKIIGSIIERQSLDVDVISGATASSKSILKAVENALK
jgi:uncharacterized protein with FMN-binding domain